MANHFFTVCNALVDATEGVIKGVSVISEGEAKGHGLQIDSETLAQVKSCSEKYAGGLKVKLNHGSGVEAICGTLRNFRITGEKLIADLFLLKTHSDFSFLIELAETIPDTFGISIAFSGMDETKGEYTFARCQEIYSADLVSEPAANPTGLFETKVDKGAIYMTEQKPDPMAECLSRLAALEKKFEEFPKSEAPKAEEAKKDEEKKKEELAEFPPKKEDEEEKKEEKESEMEAIVNRALVKALSNCGVKPVSPSAEDLKKQEEPKAKTFTEIVQAHPEYKNNKAEAISLCIKSNPTEYKAAFAACDLKNI